MVKTSIVFFTFLNYVVLISSLDLDFLFENIKDYKPLNKDSISSDIITIDTSSYKNNSDKYDLLQSIAIYDNSILVCQYERNNYFSHKISKATLLESFTFSNRTYFFYKYEGLQNGVQYKILCDSKDKPKYKNIIQFPKSKEITKLLSFGDWSEGDLGTLSKKLISSYNNKVDAIIFLGDMAYDLDINDGEKGNSFMEFIREISSVIPFQLSVGNHESFNKFIHYQSRFNLPNRSQNKTFYYSYDINNVHLISLNSEILFNKETFSLEDLEQMLIWLNKDLSNNSNSDWIIVYMHRPVYCSMPDKDCIEDSETIRQIFEEIFIKFNVDLVITGHRHNYERLYPIYKYKVDTSSLFNNNNTYLNPMFPSYVVCGATGNEEGMETKICNFNMIKIF